MNYSQLQGKLKVNQLDFLTMIIEEDLLMKKIFSRVHATLQPAPSVRPSVGNTLLFFIFLGRLELF